MKINLILVFFFTSHLAFGQIQQIATTSEFFYGAPKTATLDDKLFFRSINNVWQSDGTSQGTFAMDFVNGSSTFLKISKDSLLIASINSSSGTQLTDYHLITKANGAPELMTSLPGVWIFDLRKQGQNIIAARNGAFTFFNIDTREINTTSYPLLGPIYRSHWIIQNNQIIAFNNTQDLFSIDIASHQISKIYHSPFSIKQLLHNPDSSLVLLLLPNQIYATDGSTNGTKKIKQYSSNKNYIYSLKHYKINGAIVFAGYNISPDDETTTTFFRTDGTTNGTFELHTFSSYQPIAFLYYYNFFTIGDTDQYLYFLGENHIWRTDGTINGTELFNTTPELKMTYGITNTPKGLLISGIDSSNIEANYFFNGQSSLIPFSTSNPKENRYIDYSFIKYATDQHLYLDLLDYDYGLSLQRYNYETNQIEFIDNLHSKWNQIQAIGHLKNKFFFSKDIENKRGLFVIDESAHFAKRPDLKTNYNWAEGVSQFERNISFSDFTLDHQNNTIISIKSKSDVPIIFKNNRKSIHPSSNSIAKLDANGQLLWSKVLPSSIGNVVHTTDSEANIIVGLKISTNTIIDGTSISHNDGGLVLLKFSPQGHLNWIQQAKIGINGDIQQIKTDHRDQIDVIGKFSGTKGNFGGIKINSPRNKATFLAQYTSKGQCLWAKSYPLPSNWPIDQGSIQMDIDKNNHIFFFQRIGVQQSTTKCDSPRHRFKILHINGATGQTIWEREYESDDFCFPADIEVSPFDEIFVIGGYTNTIDFDEFQLESDSCLQNNRFLLKLNKNGQIIQAEKLKDGNGNIHQIKFNQKGDYFITYTDEAPYFFNKNLPNFQDTIFFPNNGHIAIIIEQYNRIGQLSKTYPIRQNSVWGTKAESIKPKINITEQGQILLACNHQAFLDTFNISYTNSNKQEIFLLNFLPELLDQEDLQLTQNSVSAFPNPTTDHLYIQSTDLDFSESTITIYSMDGKQWSLAKEKNHGFVNIHTKNLPPGVYVAVVRLDKQVLAQKFVKIE